jgi:hypothetical protein
MTVEARPVQEVEKDFMSAEEDEKASKMRYAFFRFLKLKTDHT